MLLPGITHTERSMYPMIHQAGGWYSNVCLLDRDADRMYETMERSEARNENRERFSENAHYPFTDHPYCKLCRGHGFDYSLRLRRYVVCPAC